MELAGITFTGEPAKNKKQAEKNAAMAAWSSLKQCESLLNFLSIVATIECKDWSLYERRNAPAHYLIHSLNKLL